MRRTEITPRAEKAAAGTTPDAVNDCETRRAILQAARNRFLHYGYKKTTIDEIAADAGVGKGTVYLHFEGKEAILLTIARQVKRNITEQMRCIASSLATPEEKLRRMLLARIVAVHDACHTTAHGVELVDEILQPQLLRCGREEYEAQTELLAKVLEEGVQRGDFALVSSAKEAATHLTLAFTAFLPPYVNACHGDTHCRIELQARANSLLEFILHGVRRDRRAQA